MKGPFSVIFFFILFATFKAQDVQFSQFNSIAAYYNPAFSGSFPGDFKVNSMYRNQWVGFQDRPLTSLSIAADIKFHFGPADLLNDYIAANVNFITDRAQAYDWNSNEISLSLAYHKLLQKYNRSFLTGAFSFGVTQRSVNYDNIYFEDQFDGISKYSNPTSELLPSNIHSKPSLKAGLQYRVQFSKKLGLRTGFSLHKLFKPELSFYQDFKNKDYNGESSSTALAQYNFILNLLCKVTNLDELYPKIMYSVQGPHGIIIAGLGYRKSFYQLNETAFHGGITSRMVRSMQGISPVDIGLQFGIELKTFVIGIQYDFGINDAFKYKAPSHSFELSLSLYGEPQETETSLLPRF